MTKKCLVHGDTENCPPPRVDAPTFRHLHSHSLDDPNELYCLDSCPFCSDEVREELRRDMKRAPIVGDIIRSIISRGAM